MAAVKKKRDVTAALREAIIGGQFMPSERLIEVELATRFKSNRVQIRTALSNKKTRHAQAPVVVLRCRMKDRRLPAGAVGVHFTSRVQVRAAR